MNTDPVASDYCAGPEWWVYLPDDPTSDKEPNPMPTFDDPGPDAAEAAQALRGLAHASRTFADPADTYPVLGDLLAGVRSLGQVIDQLATTHLNHRGQAHDDAGNHLAGTHAALAAADELHQAATWCGRVEARLDAAMQHSGRIAWHRAPAVEPVGLDCPPAGSDLVAESSRRWVSVVFLQGDEAGDVLALIDRDGPDAAIEHLKGYDYGEETTQAALENGYVYEDLPTGTVDEVAVSGVYTLSYNHHLGHVSLLRDYDTPPDHALTDRPGSALAHPASAGPARRGVSTSKEPVMPAVAQDWFAAGDRASQARGRGLSL